MDILFADEALEALCTTEKFQKKKLGKVGSKKLQSRLADIMAAHRVSDLVAGRPHPLHGDRAGQFALNLDGGRRIVFEPANEPLPLHTDQSIDWMRVTAVRIVFIGNYHD